MCLGYHTLFRGLRTREKRNKALALGCHVLDTLAPMAILVTLMIATGAYFLFCSLAVVFNTWVQIKLVVNQKPSFFSFSHLNDTFLSLILLLLKSK